MRILAIILFLSASAPAADKFTVVVLPDTQNYTKFEDINDKYYKAQTRWIVQNRSRLNVAFVLHLGDIQQDGNPRFADGQPTPWLNGDESQWRRADEAMAILERGHVPYSVVAGNHDYLRSNRKEQPGYFLKWFGPQRFEHDRTFGGASPATTTSLAGMNSYHCFEAGGYQFLNLALQFLPDDHDLAWAQQIINQNPGLPTIVTTHAYIKRGGYQYRALWEKFIKINPQIILTINGHLSDAYLHRDKNIAGQIVAQILVDYQNSQFQGHYVGGGYLRTMEFDTRAGQISVKSYSPAMNSYMTDADNQFTLAVDFRKRFGDANRAGKEREASFQQGVDDYRGTSDTYVSAEAPAAAHDLDPIAWVDGDCDDTAPGAQPAHGLIRFESIFQGNRIPAGAIIRRAHLVLHTSNVSDSHSTHHMSVHRSLKPWSAAATWANEKEGISSDGVEAILGANGSIVPAVRGKAVDVDVTESVAAWAAGAPNCGWAVLPGGIDGWGWETSEAPDSAVRPMLKVFYTLSGGQ